MKHLDWRSIYGSFTFNIILVCAVQTELISVPVYWPLMKVHYRICTNGFVMSVVCYIGKSTQNIVFCWTKQGAISTYHVILELVLWRIWICNIFEKQLLLLYAHFGIVGHMYISSYFITFHFSFFFAWTALPSAQYHLSSLPSHYATMPRHSYSRPIQLIQDRCSPGGRPVGHSFSQSIPAHNTFCPTGPAGSLCSYPSQQSFNRSHSFVTLHPDHFPRKKISTSLSIAPKPPPPPPPPPPPRWSFVTPTESDDPPSYRQASSGQFSAAASQIHPPPASCVSSSPQIHQHAHSSTYSAPPPPPPRIFPAHHTRFERQPSFLSGSSLHVEMSGQPGDLRPQRTVTFNLPD